MARFQKAEAKQAALKVSAYGPPGSGKTFTTLLMAEGLAKVRSKRVAYVDTERGTDFYVKAVAARKIHPEAFDIDALYTRSIADVTDAIRSLDPKVHGVVVLDSMSHIWDSAIDAYKGKKVGKGEDKIPMQAWGSIKKPYKDLLAFLIASPFDVFILGRQKNVFDTKEDDEGNEKMTKTGVGMRAEGETAYEPHICLRLESQSQDRTQTEYATYCYVEKDRSGVLAGQVIKNPSFETIAPILPLLGAVQAPLEDEDERIAKDGELLAKEGEKAKAKEEKSTTLFQDLQGRLVAAKSVEDIGAVAEEIKKQKRYLVESHENALREIYKSRRDKVVNEAAADI
jgi:hypothetical protein